SIQDIEEVRPGRQSEGLQKNARDLPDGCCFSIFFKGQRKNLDLVASSEKEAMQWVMGLKKVIRLSDNLNSKQKQEHCLRKADTNSDSKMTFKELKHFLGEINIKIDDLYAEKLFNVREAQHFLVPFLYTEKLINECDRSHSKMLEGPEIEEFYKRLTHRNEIEVIYSKYAGSKGKMTKEKKLMSRDGFLMYLQSSDGLVLNPTHTLVYQDMSQPLNHYFISSSHNTYLMEDQLKGPSSTEAYVRAFTKGCRCVELDCWDGPNGDPVIYHGYTLTSKILFKDVIKTVKEYAFKQLKGKILVKGKKLQSREHSMMSPESLQGEEEESVSEEDEAADLPEVKNKPKKSKLKLARELSDLVIFCKSVHFPDFETARETQAFYEMSSFEESKALKLAQESANSFVIHNTRQLSRTYPRGIRTDSSNYNPVDLWSAGCQIVALNFQTSDNSMDLNQGKFQQNGFSGYILKPRFMRDGQTQFDPTSLTQGEWLTPKKLHVMIISGQQLPKENKNKNNSVVDPLVRIEISGVPRDVCSAETEHIEDNGYRHVPLLTKEGNPIASSSIFIHIMVVDQ
ncbi:UNVERIFIED_CONTAM: hypothetical protein FKN15_041592, partial [Acipenser sinensis]